MRVLVVGAGVIGLTCAVRLAEAGHDVAVVARDLPLETTSAVAAALWYPYRALPQDRVTAWAQASYAEFSALAAAEPRAGVRLVPGTEVIRRPSPDPWWAAAVPDLQRSGHVPAGYRDAWCFTAPVVQMPVYLPWLQARLECAGGTVTRMALAALPDRADTVVNACGLSGRLLGGDPSVVPVRGQVVYVEQFGLDRWWLDADGPTYVVPREHDVVVGGTDEEGRWEPLPDAGVEAQILQRAARLVPALTSARVLGCRAGLRPARPQVRLERELRGGGRQVVHCYGHGGAGVTLSWGCADDVLRLVGQTSEQS
ncbi:MAG: FAD-binding oxidoreductase [Actinomycetota bacterium]|nr:FAD-binding oxidoreductase [Actinomycetota bacterium]